MKVRIDGNINIKKELNDKARLKEFAFDTIDRVMTEN